MAFVATHEELWREIASIAAEQGLVLYDAERINRDGLRIFVDRKLSTIDEAETAEGLREGEQGETVPREMVTSQDCYSLCRRLGVYFAVEGRRFGLPDDDPELEVSSPGINRHLRLPQHFVEAVGRRIKVVFASPIVVRREGRDCTRSFAVGQLTGYRCREETAVEEKPSLSDSGVVVKAQNGSVPGKNGGPCCQKMVFSLTDEELGCEISFGLDCVKRAQVDFDF